MSLSSSLRRRASVVLALAGLAVAGSLLAAAPASASEPLCNAPLTRTVPNIGARTVLHCPIWTKAPVVGLNWYQFGSTNNNPQGYLVHAGYANWFVCADYSAYTQTYWAFTQADNGAWGWVSGYYYQGDSDYWPNLPGCSSNILATYGNHGLLHWCGPNWCSIYGKAATEPTGVSTATPGAPGTSTATGCGKPPADVRARVAAGALAAPVCAS